MGCETPLLLSLLSIPLTQWQGLFLELLGRPASPVLGPTGKPRSREPESQSIHSQLHSAEPPRFGTHTRRCKGLIPLLGRLVTVANHVAASCLKVNGFSTTKNAMGFGLRIAIVTFRCCRMATAMPIFLFGKSAGPSC